MTAVVEDGVSMLRRGRWAAPATNAAIAIPGAARRASGCRGQGWATSRSAPRQDRRRQRARTTAADCTAAGVPARIIGCVDVPEPALEMDQRI
ncbi:hypothetical protein [Reyranella sp.]|uniref:hypothetical protein n=1 Tax=Reyranella sp. TaxID=1929291 RepID=UPI003783DC9E